MRRGLSLAELLVALAVLGLLGLTAVLAVGPARGRAGARALATLLAEELRLARRQAIASQETTAVVFPSAGGTRAHCQSFAVLQGEVRGQVRRIRDLSSEHPATAVFCGVLAPSAQLPPPAPAGWLPTAHERNYCLIFTPDGRVASNGLPLQDGSYRLLVSQGVVYSPVPSPPGPASALTYYAPTQTGEACEIRLTPGGDITALRSESGRATLRSPLSAAPALSGPDSANRLPEIVGITSLPEPIAEALPAGADCSVSPRRHLTLRVEATDADGDALFCRFQADGGAFGQMGEIRMQWDSTAARWHATGQWMPPYAAAPNDRFRLEAVVRDARGGIAAPTLASIRNVTVLPPGKLFFWGDGMPGNLYRMYPDGTGHWRLTNTPAGESEPAPGPDGTKVVYLSDADGDREVFIMNADGTGQQQLTFNTVDDASPRLSPSGTRIAYASAGDICLMNADGTGRVQLTATGDNSHPAWAPDEDRLVFSSRRVDIGEIFVMDVDGSNVQQLSNGPGRMDTWPRWSPDPADPWIVYQSWVDSADSEVRRVRPNGTSNSVLKTSAVGPEWSPDGQLILVNSSGMQKLDKNGQLVQRIGPSEWWCVWSR